MKDLYVSWDEYNRLIEKLAVKIWDSGWEFDAIVCLARGGLRVGDVLSRVFRKPLGILFTSSYREKGGTMQSHLVISDALCSAQPLPGSRWLLVDDLADSGDTLAQVVPEIRRRNPQVEQLRCAVLWRKGASKTQADYELEILPTNPWIHQPFEEYDHMGAEDLKARWG